MIYKIIFIIYLNIFSFFRNRFVEYIGFWKFGFFVLFLNDCEILLN